MNDALLKLIGKGLRFPIVAEEGTPLTTSGTERINQSLLMLFETPKGSRMMLPDYGTNLHTYKFELNDDILVAQLRESLIADVERWEPRVRVAEINFYRDNLDIDNHLLYVYVRYHVINTDVEGNFVYNFKTEPYATTSNDAI